MDRWIGKCAVVTGASVGIGAAIAVALADAGMVVVAAARRLEKLKELQKKVSGSGKLLCYRCDIGKENEIISLMEFAKKEAGGIDILVNNAAVLPTGSITDCDGRGHPIKSIEESFQINVMSVVTATRIAATDMRRRNVEGQIILINSISGHKIVNLSSGPGVSVYPATKYALTAINEVIRLEFSYTGSKIRMTSISPGAVDTAMLHSIDELPKELPQLKPVDVANSVIYVISQPQTVNITELTIQPTGEKM